MLSNVISGNATTFLGRIVAWSLPEGGTWQHSDIVTALTAAGLNPKAARLLCKRHAFVRVMRSMAKKKLVRVVEENRFMLTFQMNGIQANGGVLTYPLETQLRLNKITGVITSKDPQAAAAATALLNTARNTRRNADISRLLLSMFAKQADLFAIKGGCYFVPEKHAAFTDKVETFLKKIGGFLYHYPIPEGTSIGNQSISVVVADSLTATIDDYEKAIEAMSYDADAKTFERIARSLRAADNKIYEYRNYLATHAARLEDHLAFVESRLIAKMKEVVGTA